MFSALSLPQLSDCRRIFLHNYALGLNIGIYDAEKTGAQRVIVNVDLFVPLADTPSTHDKIDEVLDYDFIRDSIQARAARGHINLLETFCDDVARELLRHPLARAVRLSIQKPDVYPDCESVGVEVFHLKGHAP